MRRGVIGWDIEWEDILGLKQMIPKYPACVICFKAVRNDTPLAYFNCGHFMCQGCLTIFVKRHIINCPNCRTEITRARNLILRLNENGELICSRDRCQQIITDETPLYYYKGRGLCANCYLPKIARYPALTIIFITTERVAGSDDDDDE